MQKLQLSIPEPCHENWQHMTPTEQGRFCNACAKEVVDFSMMTDTEMLNYFSSITHQKVCGRALPSQLERNICYPKESKKRLFWYWNYIVMFFMFFGKGNNAKAQGGVIPTTEIVPVKPNDIRGAKVATDIINKAVSRVVTGKVTDIDGNPVSFATIKIKRTSTGLSADANGAYSIRVQQNTVLIISGASFKTHEVPIGMQNVINTVLEKSNNSFLGDVVVTVGGIRHSNSDDYYGQSDRLNCIAVLAVKDESSGNAIKNAVVIITKNAVSDSAITDKKGVYKIKGIKPYDRYSIEITADGYEPNVFAINETDFNGRKKIWEVLLRKDEATITEKTKLNLITSKSNTVNVKLQVAGATIRSASNARVGSETVVKLGSMRVIPGGKMLIYVVDGIIAAKEDNINPDDVEDYTVLQAPAAIALYGSDGANGAIVITTRKSKVRNLDTVTVTSEFGLKRTCHNGVSCVPTENTEGKNKIITSSTVEVDNNFKVYPNPVQRGNSINLSLHLNYIGLYQIQITDVAGRTILYKRISVTSKAQNEIIQCNPKWNTGIYYISIINSKNEQINKSSFVVQ